MSIETSAAPNSSASRFKLADALALRAQPLAGLFIVLTAKCPLLCAHCSTESLMGSPDADEENLLAFARTVLADDPLRFVMLTGGEPLLFPRRVEMLAETFASVGISIGLLTGLYFAKKGDGSPPKAVVGALDRLGHLTVSMDKYHEVQVRHDAVKRFLHWALDRGLDVSVQVTHAPRDSYGHDAVADIRGTFGDSVEVFEGSLRPVGRAASLKLSAEGQADQSVPRGCAMLSWPVVRVDGQVVRCCSYEATESVKPAPHLLLGDIRNDTWPQMRDRFFADPAIRTIRACGPLYMKESILGQELGSTSYCGECSRFRETPVDVEILSRFGRSPVMKVLEDYFPPTVKGA